MADIIKKEPLIRIAKRAERSNKQKLIIRLLSVLLAICAGGIFILILGKDPFSYYAKMVKGAFIGKNAASPFMPFKETIKIMIPLLISSLGITLAFKMKFWNIGAEGQIIMGGVFASYFALYHYDMPHYLLFIVMFVAAMIGGGLYGIIPAFFKAKWNTNETLSTLMMNYIATQLVAFYTIVWEVPKGSGKIGIINQNTNVGWLPQIFGSKYLLSIVVAVVITIFMYVYLNYSKQGYEISVVGESENTAKYVGIKVEKVIIRTMLLSGALCGLVGLLLVGGINHTPLQVDRDLLLYWYPGCPSSIL